MDDLPPALKHCTNHHRWGEVIHVKSCHETG